MNTPEQHKISVIVPVFNDDNLISRCIESVVKQSYSNFELILVDDCSDDLTLSICQYYENLDKRIKVISTSKNQGVAAARNHGLSHTTGNLISFLDSDDFLANYALERLVNAYRKSNADVVIGNFFVNGNQVRDCFNPPLQESGLIELDQFVDYIRGYLRKPTGRSSFMTVWAKLFKATVIKNRGVQFDNSLHVYEDQDFNFKYFRWVRTAYFVEDPIYYYQVNMNARAKLWRLTNNFLGYKKLVYSIGEIVKTLDSKTQSVDNEVGHCLVAFSIRSMMQLVEHSMNRELSVEYKILTELFNEIVQDRDIQRSIVHYVPGPQDSVIIPSLIRLQWTHPLILVCKFKLTIIKLKGQNKR